MTTSGSLYECSLIGLLDDRHLNSLLERLVGMCGYIDFNGDMNLHEHEIVFSPTSSKGTYAYHCKHLCSKTRDMQYIQLGIATTGFGKFETLLRLKSSYLPNGSNIVIPFPDRPW